MLDTIRSRGPDASGIHREAGVGLGHARLAVLDLTPTGAQPMASPDGDVVITYNGEVYNFPELRRELEALGHSFRGRSDTEVVLAAWRAWGAAAFTRLNGMFALAIWDRLTRTLVLARDRLGIKPLYVATVPGGLVFGSEIKALLASGAVASELDANALPAWLYYGVPLGGQTMFRGVEQLRPGCFLEAGPAGVRTVRYWRVADVAPVADPRPVAVERVQGLLRAAVQRQLVADVPVGLFLSGGIDSSAIACLAVEAGHRPATFSAGFDFEGDVDELPRAAALARRLGTEHHELRLRGGDLPEVIEALVERHDQPFADAANIPLYLLCQALGGSIKVVLQGDGGDEMFAGYRRYDLLVQRRLQLVARLVRRPLGLVPRTARTDRALRMVRALGAADRDLRLALLLTEEDAGRPPTRVLAEPWRRRLASVDPFARYREVLGELHHLDPAQRMLWTDAQILLPDVFLEKVDRATMAHGIEVRVPFLDHELADYALGLPSALKVRPGSKKDLLRAALRGIVPDEVLDGPKTGFGVPYAHWLRTSLAGWSREVLLDPVVLDTGLLDRVAVEALLAEHRDGTRKVGFLLWKLVQLALWLRRYRPAISLS